MNISQHVFCPLGFTDGYYDDSMNHVSSSTWFTSVLSPAYGLYHLRFFDLVGVARYYSPLTSVDSNVTFAKHNPLTSVFLCAKSFRMSASRYVSFISF